MFSGQVDENFQPERVDDKTRRFSVKEFLKTEIQDFLNKTLRAQTKDGHLQSIAVVSGKGRWNPTTTWME